MTKKPLNYKIYSEELDKLLNIKALKVAEEEKIFNILLKTVKAQPHAISDVSSYRKLIVDTFISDKDEFYSAMETVIDEDEKEEILRKVYDSIVAAYVPFSLDQICAILNRTTYLNLNPKLKASNIFGLNKPTFAPTDKVGINSLIDIIQLELKIKEAIIGQDDAIDSIIRNLKLIVSGLSKRASMLFVGPTGVGKSQLSKLIGEKYSGNFFRINCAEYASAHEYAKLIGAPPGFVGFTEKSILAEKSEKSNKWVFLFDEIEKAHHKLYDFLLSVLDDGTCTDNLGKVLDFSESIFLFTSNKGMNEVNRSPVGFLNEFKTESIASTVKDSVKDHFSPEFLNRLDDIIVFNSLTKKDAKRIAEIELGNYPIEVSDSLLDYIVAHGYSEEYGARNIARFIKKSLLPQVAQARLTLMQPNPVTNQYQFKFRGDEPEISLSAIDIGL